MEKNKKLYESPSVLIFEVRQEGVVCASPGGSNEGFGMGNSFGDDDFNN